MDYYEELGLDKAASVEEIRQAYRQLARLIHPDQQPDNGLRRLAETQMKRLNMILAVLSDPAQRRQYDASLAPAVALVRIPRQPPAPGQRSALHERILQVHRSVWVWVSAAAVGILTIGIFFGYYGRTGPALAERAAVKQAPPPLEVEREPEGPAMNAPTRERSPQRFAAGHTIPLPATTHQEPPKRVAPRPPEPAVPEPGLALAVPRELPPVSAPFVEIPNVKPAAAPSFGGNWVYSQSADPKDSQGLYAPEYIEMKITEMDGQLQGLHRARYLVTDRAISSAVVFRFEGRAAAPLSTLPWSGPGGARGNVTLRLISENSLEVRWTASRLSDELGLISGVATLVRRREP